MQTWGGVYPRTGWTTQAEEPKAAAINAQRAGDIVTRAGQPHVYVALSDDPYMFGDLISIVDDWVDEGFGELVNHWYPVFSGEKVWPPGPLVEKDEEEKQTRRDDNQSYRIMLSTYTFGSMSRTTFRPGQPTVDLVDEHTVRLEMG